MAENEGQRSEQPTPRRKQKAREEGQVPSSRDFTSAVQFAAAVLMLWVYGGEAVAGLVETTRGLLRQAFEGRISIEMMRETTASLATGPLSFLGLYALVLVSIGILSHMSQTGFALAPKRLTPNFNRLNPKQKLTEARPPRDEHAGIGDLSRPRLGFVRVRLRRLLGTCSHV